MKSWFADPLTLRVYLLHPKPKCIAKPQSDVSLFIGHHHFIFSDRLQGAELLKTSPLCFSDYQDATAPLLTSPPLTQVAA
jgi:hypothetical protein